MERKYVGEAITDAKRDARNRHNIRTETENSDTKRQQTPRHTGSDSVKIRNYRAAVVCLVVLCVLLLTAVIVMGVNLHNMIEEFYIKNKHFIDEIDELHNRKNMLDNNVTKLLALKEELNKTQELKKENIVKLWTQISKMDGWKCYQSSLYYVSSQKKSWTESHKDCTERGAHLIIINSKEEQDFVKIISGNSEVWIGLKGVKGTWRFVDDSTPRTGFWASGKPSNNSDMDCAVNLSSGFADDSCDKMMNWICEKKNVKN